MFTNKRHLARLFWVSEAALFILAETLITMALVSRGRFVHPLAWSVYTLPLIVAAPLMANLQAYRVARKELSLATSGTQAGSGHDLGFQLAMLGAISYAALVVVMSMLLSVL